MTNSLLFSRQMMKLFRRTQNFGFLLTKCRFSSSPTCEEEPHGKLETTQPGLLESWFFGVERFGKVHISVPFNLNIESLDPQQFPDMGKLFVKLNYTPDNVNDLESDKYSNTSLAALTKLYEFKIDTSDSDNISVCAKLNSLATFPAVCTIQLPLNFDLNVECTGKLTSVKNMETNKINISTINSSCALHNIKGEFITVHSKDGDISCKKVVQGNIDMSVKGKGSIKTDRIQGQSIKCCVEEGNIAASSVYSTSSEFSCNHGNINLTNVHGTSKTTINKGDLALDSLDGSLESHVQNGSTNIFISRPETVNIKSDEGDITIKLSKSTVSLDVEGKSVICDDKLGLTDIKIESGTETERLQSSLSGIEGQVKATTQNGKIFLQHLDWMESLKLQHQSRTDEE